ncbi:hypothetical protein [Bdellovibrio bacteriovorus]|uniref:hypothetical protein n=1 Tax=Bdellovibrio bacteriovorus TaxID=959 RepID=UPI0035A84DE8
MKKTSLLSLLFSTLCSISAPVAFAQGGSVAQRPDLQTIAIKDVGFNSVGYSDDLTFTIPVNTKSFLIQFNAETDYAGVYFDSVSDPNGHFVVGKPTRKFEYISDSIKDMLPYMEWENPVASSGITGVATALIGNNLDTKIIPGTWTVKFSCKSAQSECRNLKGAVQIVLKKNISTTQRPTIPLRLHFAGKSKWTASSAPRNKDFKLFMKVLEDIFKFSGVNIEVLSMDDTEDTVFENQAQGLEHMLKYSKGDAVNVYFAKTGFQWLGRDTIAIAYQLPGGYKARYSTGVMIRMKTILSRAEQKAPNGRDYTLIDDTMSIPEYALITAHEIAHYLGLFHVCEVPAFGVPMGVKDPLNSACDPKNMMFPTQGEANFYLTPAQVEVIKRHPLVY